MTRRSKSTAAPSNRSRLLVQKAKYFRRTNPTDRHAVIQRSFATENKQRMKEVRKTEIYRKEEEEEEEEKEEEEGGKNSRENGRNREE